jgi:hypothetical protein
MELEGSAGEDSLGKLMTSSLVDWAESVGRYRLHDLARSFSDRQMDEAERESARRKHAAHYLVILRKADALYKQAGVGGEEPRGEDQQQSRGGRRVAARGGGLPLWGKRCVKDHRRQRPAGSGNQSRRLAAFLPRLAVG